MVLKNLARMAQDMWRMCRMPAQVRAKDTRLAFTDIIVRLATHRLHHVMALLIRINAIFSNRAARAKKVNGSVLVLFWN